MNSQFFTYQDATLHYLKTGNGPEILLTFHGFGQDHKAFKQFAQELDGRYAVYSFDLIFHGESTWSKGETPLEKSFWQHLLQAFLQQENISRFSLMGFSMGAKFALASLEVLSKQIDSVILLAPDGIKTSFWYSLATYPLMLRSLFKSLISKPNRFNAITRFAHRVSLIDKSMLRFVESQMNTEVKRKRVYLSWVVFRHLKFDMNQIASLINSNKIQLTMVVGSFDKIITVKSMNRLLNKVDNPNLVILETGHNEILSKWLATKSQNGILY
jgi:pimeloyl-ACP methyl ester carboxylesterase